MQETLRRLCEIHEISGFVKLEKPRKFYEKSRLFFRKIREIFQNIQKALIKFVKSENPRFAIKKT